MGAVLLSLLPVIIGTAVVPVMIIIVLLILSAEGGTGKGALFVLGLFLMRLVQGLVFGLVLRPDATDGASDEPAWVLSTLLLALGTLLLVSAVKTLLTDVDPDAPPPRWMAMLDGLTAGKAFLMGAGLTAISPKMWLFSLAAVSAIRAAGLATAAGALTFIIYDLLAVSIVGLLVLLAAVAPAWADKNLDALSGWMERHNRAITVAVSLIFGALFFYNGYTGLFN